jgi:hypothetical protein
LVDDIPTIQKHMIESIMTLPGMTLEEEFCRRSTTANTVAAYCKFQEGSPTLTKEASSQLMAVAAERQSAHRGHVVSVSRKETKGVLPVPRSRYRVTIKITTTYCTII